MKKRFTVVRMRGVATIPGPRRPGILATTQPRTRKKRRTETQAYAYCTHDRSLQLLRCARHL